MTAAKLSYSVAEAAAATGVSQDVIRRAIRAGELEAKYPTSRPVIKASVLDAWIDAAPSDRPKSA